MEKLKMLHDETRSISNEKDNQEIFSRVYTDRKCVAETQAVGSPPLPPFLSYAFLHQNSKQILTSRPYQHWLPPHQKLTSQLGPPQGCPGTKEYNPPSFHHFTPHILLSFPLLSSPPLSSPPKYQINTQKIQVNIPINSHIPSSLSLSLLHYLLSPLHSSYPFIIPPFYHRRGRN